MRVVEEEHLELWLLVLLFALPLQLLGCKGTDDAHEDTPDMVELFRIPEGEFRTPEGAADGEFITPVEGFRTPGGAALTPEVTPTGAPEELKAPLGAPGVEEPLSVLVLSALVLQESAVPVSPDAADIALSMLELLAHLGRHKAPVEINVNAY